MNRRIVAAVAGGSLSLGILVGFAGAVAVWDVASPAVTSLPAHMAAMNGMHEHMAGLGSEMAPHMTEMMGSGMMGSGMMGSGMMGSGMMGSGMMGSGMMGSGHMGLGPIDPASGSELHRQHHPDAP